MGEKKFYIKTFGCQMNVYDSNIIESKLIKAGYIPTDKEEEADLIIYNTCAVRQKAEERAIWHIKSAASKFKKGSKIAVIGCVAQEKGEKLKKELPFVNYIIGTDEYKRFDDIIKGKLKDGVYTNVYSQELYEDFIDDVVVKGPTSFVTIIRGCNNFCSYCIVPYVRGRERSRKKEKIIDEVKKLVDKGIKEVILLGQNVNSYIDGNIRFPDLLYEVAKVEGIERIGFLTSHPKDFSKELAKAIAGIDKVLKYLHLPFQSGSNRILKMMNRKYTREEYLEKIELMRNLYPEIALSTDIIVGFPTETEEDFEKTLDLVRIVEFDSAFMFIYSPREGTLAAKIYKDNVPREVKVERINRLISLQMEFTTKKSLSKKGSIQRVLFYNRNEKGQNIGKTMDYKSVIVESDEDLTGEILDVYIKDASSYALIGELTLTKVNL